MDILDGTPLLDIKPYIPAFDEQPEARTGWLERARKTVSPSSPALGDATFPLLGQGEVRIEGGDQHLARTRGQFSDLDRRSLLRLARAGVRLGIAMAFAHLVGRTLLGLAFQVFGLPAALAFFIGAHCRSPCVVAPPSAGSRSSGPSKAAISARHRARVCSFRR